MHYLDIYTHKIHTVLKLHKLWSLDTRDIIAHDVYLEQIG